VSYEPTWAVGVTTVKERRSTTLPRTLASLEAAGFARPRLFVDDPEHALPPGAFAQGDTTFRTPRIRAYGNWLLGLAELIIRQPLVDYYAVFQDDIVTLRNLRAYLEKCTLPRKSYWNLYLTEENLIQVPLDPRPDFSHSFNYARGRYMVGWHRSKQTGKGAVATIFSQEAAYLMLGTAHSWTRLRDLRRGWQAIDGGIVWAMNQQGCQELIHYPALVQHVGTESIMHMDSLTQPDFSVHNKTQPAAVDFPGEDYNALDLAELHYHAPRKVMP
jgi:hypothetical protein